MHSIQIDTIMERVQLRTLALVDEMFPDPDTPDTTPEERPQPPANAVALLAPRSGYLQTVDVDAVAEQAASSGHTVLLVTFVGDYVTAGTMLGWCWRRAGEDPPIPTRCSSACGTCTSGSSAHCSKT